MHPTHPTHPTPDNHAQLDDPTTPVAPTPGERTQSEPTSPGAPHDPLPFGEPVELDLHIALDGRPAPDEDRAPDVDPELVNRFEADRARLRAVAYRVLGSLSEAEDAVQETWLRLCRTDAEEIRNLNAWLTTVVARVCLNMLRSREARREDPLESLSHEAPRPLGTGADPEEEAEMADAVGLALLVVLDALAPAERLAFVLHDMFAIPFDEIAAMLDRTPTATRQLASRARRRVRGSSPHSPSDLARQRRIVDAFLTAARGGNFVDLVALLDPNIVLHADRTAGPTPEPLTLRGPQVVSRGAFAAAARTQISRPALINGSVGLVMAPYGQLTIALAFTFTDEKITSIDVIADAPRLSALEIASLDI